MAMPVADAAIAFEFHAILSSFESRLMPYIISSYATLHIYDMSAIRYIHDDERASLFSL